MRPDAYDRNGAILLRKNTKDCNNLIKQFHQLQPGNFQFSWGNYTREIDDKLFELLFLILTVLSQFMMNRS